MTFEHIVQINDLTKPELPVLTRCPVISIFMKRMWPQTRKPFRSYGIGGDGCFLVPSPSIRRGLLPLCSRIAIVVERYISFDTTADQSLNMPSTSTVRIVKYHTPFSRPSTVNFMVDAELISTLPVIAVMLLVWPYRIS